MDLTLEFLLYLSLTLSMTVQTGRSNHCFSPVKRETNNGTYAGNKLILILLDGFRWDYLTRAGLTGFDRIRREGVHAEYMEPEFPSLSYPNYYSIVTGRHVDSHGITLNDMWNPDTGEIWKPDSTDTSQSHWWEGAEPLWVTTTKVGLRTHMYLWPGCNAIIFNTTPTRCLPYSERILLDGFEHDLLDLTTNLERDESDVGMVYCEQPDLFGHLFGPDSFMTDIMLRGLDSILDGFMTNLENRGLRNKTNVIIVSDHGMTRVDFMAAKKISLADYLDADKVEKVVNHGSIIGIFPKAGRTDEIVQRLKGMKGTNVWKREDLPERLHYKNINTPPVILLAQPKYYINGLPSNEKNNYYWGFLPPSVADILISGAHGYDEKEFSDMRGIFLGFGPDFKIGFEAPPIKNIDVYNLAMSLIDQEAIANNGSWDSVKDLLRCSPKTSDKT